jgi:Uracil DNA glycosylase superfamily
MTPKFVPRSMKPGEHPVDYFWALTLQLSPVDYPPRVKPAPYHLEGTWGFSGGSGLYRKPGAPLPPFPFGGIMFVGSNLNSVDGWKKAEDRGDPGDPDDPKMVYWRNMRKLLQLAEVDRTEAFLTNIFSVGLMEAESATSKFPDEPSFHRWCRDFLAEQVRVMEPRLIVALGGDAQLELQVRPGQVIPPRGGAHYKLVAMQHTSSPTYYMRLSTGGRLIDREAAILRRAAA